ncbi:hypothetical protein ACEQ8H_002964 [Pleosporales sp. CAS-2024a]
MTEATILNDPKPRIPDDQRLVSPDSVVQQIRLSHVGTELRAHWNRIKGAVYPFVGGIQLTGFRPDKKVLSNARRILNKRIILCMLKDVEYCDKEVDYIEVQHGEFGEYTKKSILPCMRQNVVAWFNQQMAELSK